MREEGMKWNFSWGPRFSQSAVLNITLATIFFAFMQATVKYLKDIPFFELVFFRALVSLVFATFSLRVQKISGAPTNLKWVLIRGLSGTLALMAYFYTLQILPLTTAVTLQYLSPVFSVLWASLFFREPASVLQWIFLFGAFGGVYISKGGAEASLSFEFGLGILGAMLSGVAYNAIRHLRDSDPPARVVFHFSLFATLLAAPFAFYGWVWPSEPQWIWLFLLGLFTWVAQIFMTKAYQLEAPGFVNIISYSGVFYAALLGYFLFGEELTQYQSFGILVILISVVSSTWISKKEKIRRSKI